MSVPRRAGFVRRLRLGRQSWGFAAGSLCFFVGALPWFAAVSGTVLVNVVFAIGAVFFTIAALLQLTLTGRPFPNRGMSRGDVFDWSAAAVQLVGTVLFNASTIDALLWSIARPDELGAGWRPDAWGSSAFLLSSVLALGALVRRHELWDVRARTPAASWLNLAGSILFAVSAIGAYVVPGTGTVVSLFWTNLGTALGAVGFFLAAVLTRPGNTAASAAG